MDATLTGLLIRRARLERSWSQAGLCRGICAVSYLSKIEQGKAEADPALVALLLGRLELSWAAEDWTPAQQAQLDAWYDAVFSGETPAVPESLLHSPRFLDAMLLRAWAAQRPDGQAEDFLPAMDARQRTLHLLTAGRYDEALQCGPCALACTEAGMAAYRRGEHLRALELLGRGCELAAAGGRAALMLTCRLGLVCCCSDLGDVTQMNAHAAPARRLAKALGDTVALETIDYNLAATALEQGQPDEAYRYFSALKEPGALALHKLAVCCEALGKPDEAMAALSRAEAAPCHLTDAQLRALLDPIAYRLTHPDYLHDEAYGALLLDAFSRIRSELPSGYAQFHLPWVLEWYTAARQYKAVCELLVDFPAYRR